MSEPAVLLLAEIHGLAGRAGELRRLLQELRDAAEGEPGCRRFSVLAAEAPGELVLLAVWDDEPALRAHYATDGYRRYREQVGPLLARPSDVVVHRISSTLHPVDPNPPDPGLLG